MGDNCLDSFAIVETRHIRLREVLLTKSSHAQPIARRPTLQSNDLISERGSRQL